MNKKKIVNGVVKYFSIFTSEGVAILFRDSSFILDGYFLEFMPKKIRIWRLVYPKVDPLSDIHLTYSLPLSNGAIIETSGKGVDAVIKAICERIEKDLDEQAMFRVKSYGDLIQYINEKPDLLGNPIVNSTYLYANLLSSSANIFNELNELLIENSEDKSFEYFKFGRELLNSLSVDQKTAVDMLRQREQRRLI